MIETSIKLEGLEEILNILQDAPDLMDKSIEDIAKTMRTLSMGATPMSLKAGPRGHMKARWGQVSEHSGGFSFSNRAHYSTILEEGAYKNVGPRTVEVNGGIYSRQAPGGILTPLVEDDETLNKVVQMIVDVFTKSAGRA